jgi:hypothetical protein
MATAVLPCQYTPGLHGCTAISTAKPGRQRPGRSGTDRLRAQVSSQAPKRDLTHRRVLSHSTPRRPARTHAMSEPHQTSVGSRERERPEQALDLRCRVGRGHSEQAAATRTSAVVIGAARGPCRRGSPFPLARDPDPDLPRVRLGGSGRPPVDDPRSGRAGRPLVRRGGDQQRCPARTHAKESHTSLQ